MKCKICGETSELFDEAWILDKYLVRYFHCQHCGFLQTEDPYWLDEAYTSSITKSDIGLLQRNILLSEKAKNFILMCINPKSKFIDYGGGYGLFVRLMRDNGFDFYRFDPYCENIFSKGFESDIDSSYSLLTAWEVFEHLRDPMQEIGQMLNYSRTLMFSTLLIKTHPKPVSDWWYYGIEHGQHISFYSRQTLEYIAKKNDLILLYSDDTFHIMSDRKINQIKIKISLQNRLQLFQKIFEKPQPKSLIAHDFKLITGRDLD